MAETTLVVTTTEAVYARSQISFANGLTVDTSIQPLAGTATYQGAYRHTIEYRIPYEAMSFEEVEALYTDAEAMAKVTVTEYGTTTNKSGETVEEITGQSLHLNFTMPMELTLKAINDTKVWCMKMAQKSDVEITQEQQAEELAVTQMAVMELAAMSGGE